MSTIQERIAALNLGQVGRGAAPRPAPTSTSAAQQQQQEPPPPLPRSSSADDQSSHTVTQHRRPDVGNQPAGEPARAAPPPSRGVVVAANGQAHMSHQQQQQPARGKPPPPLPKRTSQPALPRRDSQDSVASTRSSLSLRSSRTSTSIEQAFPIEASHQRVKAPAFDPTVLPTLPPSRREKPSLPGRTVSTSSVPHFHKPASSQTALGQTALGQTTPPPRVVASAQPPVTARPGLPPRPPPRTRAVQDNAEQPSVPTQQQTGSLHEPRKTQAPVIRSALSFGLNQATEKTPTVPSRPRSSVDPEAQPIKDSGNGNPPPIPTSSRPNLAALQASKPKFTQNGHSAATDACTPPATSGSICLLCRDFSAPDNHAARFPREGLPTQDLGWLGKQLTSPFPSPTDKARAIFTWLHHNISYDTQAFFSGNLQPSTPASTLASGWAVCEGYAGLFAALAAHAGLEAVVVGGHGKGYGYAAGSPVPAGGPTGHAWNAVRIDGGEWKLCDPCWGAGHICDAAKLYKKAFNPAQFTMSNDEFGERHFPENPRFLHVANPPTFAEYWAGRDGIGEKAQVFTGCQEEHGIGESSFMPPQRDLMLRTLLPHGMVQFRFSTVCEHWDHGAKGTGPPYVFILNVGGVDGRKKDSIPFRHDAAHRNWWLEVPAAQLGCPGQSVHISYVTTIDGQSARGWTVQQFLEAKGRKSMGWSGLAAWQLC